VGGSCGYFEVLKLSRLLILLWCLLKGLLAKRGALAHLPHDSPETITEGTPSATVTLTQSHGCGEAGQTTGPQILAQE